MSKSTSIKRSSAAGEGGVKGEEREWAKSERREAERGGSRNAGTEPLRDQKAMNRTIVFHIVVEMSRQNDIHSNILADPCGTFGRKGERETE